MRLAAALSITRYNEGFAGIECLLNKLGIEVTDRMRHAFNLFDSTLARQKLKIIIEQQMRYRKKHSRGRTQIKQKAIHGLGYASGEYSGAKSSKANSDDSSSEEVERDILPPLSPGISPSVPPTIVEKRCSTCERSVKNRLVGIGLAMRMISSEIEWVQWSKCDSWYHILCLDIEDPEDIGLIWYCDDY